MNRVIFIVLTLFLSACTGAAVSTGQPKEQTILFLGDTSFYENSGSTRRLLQQNGFDYAVKNYLQILMDSDFAIANMESPIITLEDSPYEENKSYILWQSPITADYLKSFGIDAVSLGNNHTMDYGVPGLKETFDHLSNVDIEYFGAGDNSAEARKPLMHDFSLGNGLFKLTVLGGYEYREKYDDRFNFYAESNKGGMYKLKEKETANWIRTLKAEDPSRFIVIFPHWGYRYTWTTKYMNKLSKSFVDAGADLIIGHGAHQLGEIRKIDNTWVIYSLGNFMFNSWSTYYHDSSIPYSMISALHIKEIREGDPQITLRLYPIFTNNNITNHSGYFVSKKEFNEVTEIILSKSSQPEVLRAKMKSGKDKYGYFLEMNVNHS